VRLLVHPPTSIGRHSSSLVSTPATARYQPVPEAAAAAAGTSPHQPRCHRYATTLYVMWQNAGK